MEIKLFDFKVYKKYICSLRVFLGKGSLVEVGRLFSLFPFSDFRFVELNRESRQNLGKYLLFVELYFTCEIQNDVFLFFVADKCDLTNH